MKRKRQNSMSKTDPIPDNMTIEEASEFWGTHSVDTGETYSLILYCWFEKS